MLRRLRLPGKLTVAAVPLLLILVAASGLLVRDALQQAGEDRETAALAATWEPLNAALAAAAAEQQATLTALAGEGGDLSEVRSETDARIAELEDGIREAGGAEPLLRQVRLAAAALEDPRQRYDAGEAEDRTGLSQLTDGFEQVEEQLLQVGDLIPAEVTDRGFARDLAAVAALGHAQNAALAQETAVLSRLNDDRAFGATVEIVRAAESELEQSLAAFEASAPDAWLERYDESSAAFDEVGAMIDLLIESPINVLTTPDEEWQAMFDARSEVLGELQTSLTAEVIDDASAAATQGQREAVAIAAGTAAGILIAGLTTLFITRSVVRRVRSLTERAQHVTRNQLPALVEALREPGEDVDLPAIAPLRDRGADEVGDLARSFAAMQSTLEHVAEQQLEVLRKGVADIFVTLARRNRSLVDRQLALLDQLEADEEDPEMLADLYRLDHLSTRMRRNAESLLVLAGSESPRTYHLPLQIDDVVRAALGEVEDYRRIDILTLEPLEVSGRAVADLSHLLSELCENATVFSPPESRVRVAGHFHDDGYLITITDRGVGMSEERLAELNQLLDAPPVVGLALEPTLGLYVVAMLARRHGIRVRLVSGAPGITATVTIPPSLFEVRDQPTELELVGSGAASPGVNGHHAPPALDTELAPRRLRSVTELPAEMPVADEAEHTAGPTSQPESQQPPSIPLPSPPPSPTPKPDSEPAAEQPEQGSSNGLPIRVPGAAYTPDPAEDAAPADQSSPDELRERLGAFEEGRRRAEGPGDLPTRRPGANLDPGTSEDDEEDSSTPLDPAEVRRALSSYQIGMRAGRRPEEGDASDE